MILPIAFLLGGLVGWLRAAKRGGALADKMQYGVAHGLAFMLTAFFLVIVAGLIGIV